MKYSIEEEKDLLLYYDFLTDILHDKTVNFIPGCINDAIQFLVDEAARVRDKICKPDFNNLNDRNNYEQALKLSDSAKSNYTDTKVVDFFESYAEYYLSWTRGIENE